MKNQSLTYCKLLFSIIFIGFFAQAQIAPKIDIDFVTRVENELASDKTEGREIFSAGIELASKIIETEFQKIGLSYYTDLKNYRQEFVTDQKPTNNVIGVLPGKSTSCCAIKTRLPRMGAPWIASRVPSASVKERPTSR